MYANFTRKIRRLSSLSFLVSPFLILVAVYYLAHYYHVHYFSPFLKISVFIGLILLVLLLFKTKTRILPKQNVLWLECVLLLVLVFPLADYAWDKYEPRFDQGPTVDYGYTTVQAAKLFFDSRINPYREIVIKRTDNPDFLGYDKGPLSFLVYGASAFFPPLSYKMTTLFLLFMVLVAIGVLIYRPNAPPVYNFSGVIFALLLIMAHEISLKILFVNGSIDLIHILLILTAFIFIRYKKWLPAGVATGLAFSTRFAPPVLLLILLIRRDLKVGFFIGFALGLLPLYFFLAWDPVPFINNVFVWHLSKSGTATSLYAITPEELHFVFPALQFMAVAYFWLVNIFKPIQWKRLLVHFTILNILLNISFTAIRANHLIVILPFVAAIFAPYRHLLLYRLGKILKRQIVC